MKKNVKESEILKEAREQSTESQYCNKDNISKDLDQKNTGINKIGTKDRIDEPINNLFKREKIKLKKISLISTHNSLSKHIVKYKSKYRIIDMGGISVDGAIISKKNTNNPDQKLEFGDLVMVKDDIGGGNLIGSTIFINENFFVCGDHVYKIKINEFFNPLYVQKVINSAYIRTKLRKKANGTAQLSLNKKAVEEILIPIVDMEIQNKIANLLSSIDQLIEDKEALINKMKIEMKYNLTHIFTNIEGNLISLDKLSKNIKSGGTPKSTNTYFYNGDIKFLSISDLDGKYLYDTDKKINIEAIKSSSSWVVPSGTLVYTMYASPAIPFIIQDNIAIPQSVIAIELDDRLIEFIYYQLLFLKKEILKHTMTGTQANLSREIIKNIIVTIPSDDIITNVIDILSSMDNLIELHKQELEKLKQMKKYYLNKIFN